MARWQDKEREFEVIGKKFQKRGKKIYIYGAGENGTDLFSKLGLVQDKIIFIDANVKKQESGYLGREVISPTEITEELFEDAILLIAASVQNNYIIMDNLMKRGISGDYIFEWRTFIELYLPIYIFYVTGKNYFQDLTLMITEKCTLKCKHCAAYVPYMSSASHREIKELKDDVDQLFSYTDFVWNLVITGGEPFLYPSLCELLEYLKKYESNYDHIQIICNGTIIPDAKVLDLLREMKVFVFVSDYRNTLKNKKLQHNIDIFTDKLKEYHIASTVYREEGWWVDFGFLGTDRKKRDSEQASQFFDECHAYCRAFYRGGYIWCNVAFCADTALMHKEAGQYDRDNFFIPDSKVELMEWSKGYNEKGYLELCRYCNGHITVNKSKVITAEQIEDDC